MNIDLSTCYLGLKLQNPVVMSASPMTAEIHRIEQFAGAGVSAAVLPSLFAEHIQESQTEQSNTIQRPTTNWRRAEHFTKPVASRPAQTHIYDNSNWPSSACPFRSSQV